MAEYYLEIQQDGKVIYRAETSRPIGLSNITLTAGEIVDLIDRPEVEVDCTDHVEPAKR